LPKAKKALFWKLRFGMGQARSQVLKFGGAKYIFRGHDFCFYNIFKRNVLGTIKFLGELPTVATGLGWGV